MRLFARLRITMIFHALWLPRGGRAGTLVKGFEV